jgi:hypothetical protein
MLAYLDRAPCALPLPERTALMGFRLWAAELRRDRCPLTALRFLYARFGASGALWPAHNFQYWVLAHAARPIELGCPCCGGVKDDEALILAAQFAASEEQACAALAPLVTPVAHAGAVRLARRCGEELARATFP